MTSWTRSGTIGVMTSDTDTTETAGADRVAVITLDTHKQIVPAGNLNILPGWVEVITQADEAGTPTRVEIYPSHRVRQVTIRVPGDGVAEEVDG